MAKNKNKILKRTLSISIFVVLAIFILTLLVGVGSTQETSLFAEPDFNTITVNSNNFKLENPEKISSIKLTVNGCIPVDEDDQLSCGLPTYSINGISLGVVYLPKCSSGRNSATIETDLSGFKENNEIKFEGVCKDGFFTRDLVSSFELELRERIECREDVDCYNPLLLRAGKCVENICETQLTQQEEKILKAQIKEQQNFIERNLYWILVPTFIILIGLIIWRVLLGRK